MNEQMARSLLMDYMYNEIEDDDKLRLEVYLKKNPSLQRELDQLMQTRSLLQQMPADEPAQKLLMVEPRKKSFGQWWAEAKRLLPQTGFGRTGLAVAAGLILLLFAGSVAKLHISWSGNTFAVSMGYDPAINQGLSSQQTEVLINQIRKENAAMLAGYAETQSRQNKEQIQQVVRYLEEQRMNDLQLIDQNLDQLQQANSYRWKQANRFLGEVLQTVNFQDQN